LTSLGRIVGSVDFLPSEDDQRLKTILTFSKESRIILASLALVSICFLPGESSDSSDGIHFVAEVLDDLDDRLAV